MHSESCKSHCNGGAKVALGGSRIVMVVSVALGGSFVALC